MEVWFSVDLIEGEDAGEQEPWISLLQEELEELDPPGDAQIARAGAGEIDGAKGAWLGQLCVRVSGDAIKALAQYVRGWVIRTGRTVEVTINGDTIKITGASAAQQDAVIGSWLARHASGS